LLIVTFTKELTTFFHKSNANKITFAVWVGTHKMIGTPGLIQGQHKRPSGIRNIIQIDSSKYDAYIMHSCKNVYYHQVVATALTTCEDDTNLIDA